MYQEHKCKSGVVTMQVRSRHCHQYLYTSLKFVWQWGLVTTCFTQISQISQILFIIAVVLSHMCPKSYLAVRTRDDLFHADFADFADFIYDCCRHESYVPQKLFHRWQFSRHKWLLTSWPIDFSTSWLLDFLTSRPLDLLTSWPLDLPTSLLFSWQIVLLL